MWLICLLTTFATYKKHPWEAASTSQAWARPGVPGRGEPPWATQVAKFPTRNHQRRTKITTVRRYVPTLQDRSCQTLSSSTCLACPLQVKSSISNANRNRNPNPNPNRNPNRMKPRVLRVPPFFVKSRLSVSPNSFVQKPRVSRRYLCFPFPTFIICNQHAGVTIINDFFSSQLACVVIHVGVHRIERVTRHARTVECAPAPPPCVTRSTTRISS